MTARPSLARLRATARIRVSLSPRRKPDGSESGSVWLSSTRIVPPSSPTGTGSSRRPWVIRSSSSMRSAARAKKPSSGWCRLPSSSVITTTGRTTSCSWNRFSAPGSASRTLVSSTKVRYGVAGCGGGALGLLGRGRHDGHPSWDRAGTPRPVLSSRWRTGTGTRKPECRLPCTQQGLLRTAVVNPHERASQCDELPHSPILGKYAALPPVSGDTPERGVTGR